MTTAARDTEKGVPLVQLAAVHAALGLGFDLAEALACEGLSPESWRAADAAWRERLTGSVAEFRAYQDALGEQQDALARAVTPLDDDLEAWTTFLKIYATSAEPPALLDEIGLRNADLARLERRWRGRFDADKALTRQAEDTALKLQKRLDAGEKLPLPAIQVGSKRLVPSTAARRRTDSPALVEKDGAQPVAAQPVRGGDLEAHAQLVAALLVAGQKGRREVLLSHHLDEASYTALDAEWDARLAADPTLRGALAARTAHHERIARLREAKRTGALPAHRAPPAAPPPPPAPRVVEPLVSVKAPPSSGTLDAPGYIAMSPTLPFAAPRIVDVTPQPPAGTLDMPDYIDSGPALPFVDAAAGSPPPPSSGTGTIDLGGYLSLDAPSGLGGRTVAGMEIAEHQLPWDRAVPPSPPVERSWDGYTPSHLGSLHAELDMALQDPSAIRQRYHLANEQEQRALERHFEARFNEDPSAFAAYRQARMRHRGER